MNYRYNFLLTEAELTSREITLKHQSHVCVNYFPLINSKFINDTDQFYFVSQNYLRKIMISNALKILRVVSHNLGKLPNMYKCLCTIA